MRRFLRVFMMIAIAAFLALSPRWLLEGLARDEYRAFFERPAAAWHGKIELWHIAGFRVYQGSVTDYLQQRADAYCKKHPGVHIDVVGLTETQYNDRVKRGLCPDAYSFPAGLLVPERLGAMTLEPPALIGNLSTAQAGEEVRAVPYLMSGYCLAANTQLLTQYGFELPETADAATLQRALDLETDAPQLFMPAVHAARLGLTGALAEADAFAQGKCMFAVLPVRAYGDIVRGEKTAMLADAIPFPDYTDEVMYIGPAADATPEQAAALSGFAAFLLDEKEQLRLSSLGALPVTRTEAKPAYADDLLTALYAAYASPVSPLTFLYERHKTQLVEDALAALSGNASAKASFLERLTVVECGEL